MIVATSGGGAWRDEISAPKAAVPDNEIGRIGESYADGRVRSGFSSVALYAVTLPCCHHFCGGVLSVREEFRYVGSRIPGKEHPVLWRAAVFAEMASRIRSQLVISIKALAALSRSPSRLWSALRRLTGGVNRVQQGRFESRMVVRPWQTG